MPSPAHRIAHRIARRPCHLRLLLPLLTLLAGPAAERAEAQEPTWIVSPINGFSYALTPPGTWEASQQWAVSKGANLVTIRSAAEQEWLRATFAQLNPSGLWIGFTALQDLGVWRWANDEPVTYTNWHPGEPNAGFNWSERVGMMFSAGSWNDTAATNSLRGIAENAGPIPEGFAVWNIRAKQRLGTKIVDFQYNIRHPLGLNSFVTVEISQDGGATYGKVATITGAFGGGITTGFNKAIEWRAGNDWTAALFSNVRARISADDGQEMTLIPEGAFEMGFDNYTPTTLNVSSFQILRTEVTLREWNEVRDWALARGYSDLTGVGQSDASSKPVSNISWHHAIQWLNAKSEMEGLTPVYFATADRLELYRRGIIDLTNAHVNWNADGYRLPTEMEWEKAARGGLSRQLYISGENISSAYADINRFEEWWGGGAGGGGLGSFSKSVVSYAPNAYGLFDVSGSVAEWCWDWFSTSLPNQSDSRGPTTGTERIVRGGSFIDNGTSLKLSHRSRATPISTTRYIGFRYVRNATP